MTQGRITAVAKYLPERVVTNGELVARYHLSCSADWLQRTTGVRERRFADPTETTLSMAAVVLRQLIEAGQLRDPFVDALIMTGDDCARGEASGAALAASMAGLAPEVALDVCSAHGGFAAALDTANRHLDGGARRVLIVSSEVRSSRLRARPAWAGQDLAALLGDGAAGVLLEPGGGLGVEASARGAGLPGAPGAPGSEGAARGGAAAACDVAQGEDGRWPFSGVHRLSIDVSQRALAEAGIGMDAVRWLVAHQPWLPLRKLLCEELGVSADQHYSNVERYGDTASASLPLCLTELVETGALQQGDRILLLGMGAGSANAHVLRYGASPIAS
ncbi:3-oxoacyl-[acyl-carrier-protein] synthase III C-terminal domain-containing protein [Sorangium sp. So ce131]|uniref:3-oxoacyl-[acyl-carrier-protein] synthase III C-terminal domain-containing protein n=1 Tax=Sorangium sp. So ce131 TaxID=3133282 RepID=UPI003F5D620C